MDDRMRDAQLLTWALHKEVMKQWVMFSKADKVIVDVATAVGAIKAFHEL